MDATALLNSLDSSQLAALKAAIDGMSGADGRSPFKPRQLHDLRLLPTKDDPRPTFFWSAEQPRNAGDLSKATLYPRLMWDGKTGREITVDDAKAQRDYEAQGFLVTPPANAQTPEPMDLVRDMLEGLSEADKQLVLKGAHATRLERIKDALLGLSDEEREALSVAMASETAKATKRTA